MVHDDIVVVQNRNPDNKAREQVHYVILVPDNYILNSNRKQLGKELLELRKAMQVNSAASKETYTCSHDGDVFYKSVRGQKQSDKRKQGADDFEEEEEGD